MSHTPVFDATLADSAPDIWQASHVFPRPTPEPHISFIRERGAWENVKGIVLGARSILTPSKAPHLWP